MQESGKFTLFNINSKLGVNIKLTNCFIDTVTEDGNVAEMESLHSASQQHLDHQTSTPLEHTPTQQRTVTQTGGNIKITKITI